MEIVTTYIPWSNYIATHDMSCPSNMVLKQRAHRNVGDSVGNSGVCKTLRITHRNDTQQYHYQYEPVVCVLCHILLDKYSIKTHSRSKRHLNNGGTVWSGNMVISDRVVGECALNSW